MGQGDSSRDAPTTAFGRIDTAKVVKCTMATMRTSEGRLGILGYTKTI